MKAKLVVGIVCIMCGFHHPCLAQFTAFANIYAEVIDMGGIEQSRGQTPADFVPINNSINVILMAESEVIPQNTMKGECEKNALALFRIKGNTMTTFFIALSEGSETIGVEYYNPLKSNSISANLDQTGSINSSSTRHLVIPVNKNKAEFYAKDSFHVTLNYN